MPFHFVKKITWLSRLGFPILGEAGKKKKPNFSTNLILGTREFKKAFFWQSTLFKETGFEVKKKAIFRSIDHSIPIHAVLK